MGAILRQTHSSKLRSKQLISHEFLFTKRENELKQVTSSEETAKKREEHRSREQETPVR